MKYLLGIDFGGGASKATLISSSGKAVETASVEYPTMYPCPGFAEQNPEDWYDAARTNIREILDKSGISPNDIAAVSLDAATHTAVLCDEEFNVLCPSVYWTDTRSAQEAKFLKENYGELIDKQVLHSPDTIWTLPQLMWIKNNRPETWAKVRKIMFAKDYVRHKLTGDYVTDYIEAEGSMMFDFSALQWSKELLGIIDFTPDMMPQIVSPMDIVGHVTARAAAESGLSEGTAVICGTTDTVMEVFASGGVSTGKMTVKLATAGRICVVTDKPYKNKNLINYSHFVKGLWYPGTATKSCASSYRWYRDVFGGDYRGLDALASEIPICCSGLIFHPYLNGELTPYGDPRLCASFTGVRSEHTKAHFTRAVLEGVAMSMLDCMTALKEIGIEHEKEAAIIGGGGQSPLWRQILADALGVTLVSKKYNDSSFGSCMLAGIAAGYFKDAADAFEKCNETVCVTEPNMDNHRKYEKLFARYKKIQKVMQEIYDEE